MAVVVGWQCPTSRALEARRRAASANCAVVRATAQRWQGESRAIPVARHTRWEQCNGRDTRFESRRHGAKESRWHGAKGSRRHGAKGGRPKAAHSSRGCAPTSTVPARARASPSRTLRLDASSSVTASSAVAYR
eukprot:6651369-Prymnesium_polylepis.1